MTMTRLISADSHVLVKPDQIRAGLPAALRESFDEGMAAHAAFDKSMRGDATLSLEDFDMEAASNPGYWDPVARLAAMDRDGVEAEVLYSELSAFRVFGLMKDSWQTVSRVFTDLLVDFASHDPKRLLLSYQVPIIDIDYAVKEVERLAGLGARSVHLPNHPSEVGLADYHDERYDPLWSVLQETEISISHHLGVRHSLYDVMRRDPTPQKAIFTSMPALTLNEVLSWWILTGTLERFPRLKIVFVEPSLFWIPGFLAQLDRKAKTYNLPGVKDAPSEYFRRQMACTFMDDEVGLSMRHLIGVENILWSTDFPHPATTWPNSHESVARQFDGIDEHDRDLICHQNAARIYRL
jgi:predicted TIM-barrel fold metal-dependent hydrolase